MKSLVLFMVALFLTGCGCTVVDPGNRGVKVHLGEVTPNALPEGLVWHQPLLTSIHEVSIRQQTKSVKSEDYSSDLQQVTHDIKVLYRIPEENVVAIFQKYAGDPWESLIEPRVQQSLKAASAKQNAESLVKHRDLIKAEALASVKDALKGLIIVEDIVITNETLSKDLEHAIEQKMVQEQEAEKAKFKKIQAQTDAETAAIAAQGQANALEIQGIALRKNPETMQMEMIKKWNGVTPLVVGGGQGTNILLPLDKK